MTYTLIRIPLKDLSSCDFNMNVTGDEEAARQYIVSTEDSIIIDQLARLRGYPCSHITEMILIRSRNKNSGEDDLRHVLSCGFTYNGVHYRRFGKSASQAKNGITAFVCDKYYDVLYRISQMDIPVANCVISKYEAQRCLIFSSCTIIKDYMPNIVIIGEYKKTLNDIFIRYVTDNRRVAEGHTDIKLSPFDGCGCHEAGFMHTVSSRLKLDYNAAGVQVRMPFIKGYSVYVPFRKILREWNIEYITDIYGVRHHIDDIDCIWNTSMFKGHSMFYKQYGSDAWNMYMAAINKYSLRLGISKYSHHIKDIELYTRMNFQYIQCLKLWNSNYIRCFEDKAFKSYDILNPDNDGDGIVSIARYTTDLFENIINGNKFYTYRFLGIRDTKNCKTDSRYNEAILINDIMLHDPAVRHYIHMKLSKAINEARTGKIYCSGFYHTGVGDMLAYLQYAAGLEPVGCLNAHELYSGCMPDGDCLSLRSPLVDPSEVNRVRIVHNDITDKWFAHFKDQDIVMFNAYDISAPQQGGADFDGDIFLLCNDPHIVQAKSDKPIILDINDKATAQAKEYTAENLVEYELMTRDNRIGDITNAATCIENRYATDEAVRSLYSDFASLLRIYQGKEIDFLKTGLRWHMGAGLKKYLRQLPYFLLFNYPKEMERYKNMLAKRSKNPDSDEQVKLNAYHSPSPMNELCDYISVWEKKHIISDKNINTPDVSLRLLLDHSLTLEDDKILRQCRRFVNRYADALKELIHDDVNYNDTKDRLEAIRNLASLYREKISGELGTDENTAANYIIKVSYKSLSISKALAWSAYSDYIIDNLRANSPDRQNISISQLTHATDNSYEYLGRYYELKEEDSNV